MDNDRSPAEAPAAKRAKHDACDGSAAAPATHEPHDAAHRDDSAPSAHEADAARQDGSAPPEADVAPQDGAAGGTESTGAANAPEYGGETPAPVLAPPVLAPPPIPPWEQAAQPQANIPAATAPPAAPEGAISNDELVALLKQREAARVSRDWMLSDQLRGALEVNLPPQGRGCIV